MNSQALILLAHGARDASWAAPFERVLARVNASAPERAPMLAFLELMPPDLAAVIAAQVQRGFTSIRIVPLFLGPGGHVRQSLPRLVDAARIAHPDVRLELAEPIGEDEAVIEAIASCCLLLK